MIRSLVSHDFQPNLFLDELGYHSRLVHAVYLSILQFWSAIRVAGIQIRVTSSK